jgi:hypothetical protein
LLRRSWDAEAGTPNRPKACRSASTARNVSEPIAATYRRVGLAAEHLGIVRPSYEQVRVLVHLERRRDEGHRTKQELVESVLLGRRSSDASKELLDRADGRVPPR